MVFDDENFVIFVGRWSTRARKMSIRSSLWRKMSLRSTTDLPPEAHDPGPVDAEPAGTVTRACRRATAQCATRRARAGFRPVAGPYSPRRRKCHGRN